MQISSENQTTSGSKLASSIGSHIVGTALGFVGIVWNDSGLTRLCLFDSNRASVERRLERLEPGAPEPALRDEPMPAWVATLVAGIRAYAEGEEIDFSGVPVDLTDVDDFRRAIYDAARALAFGETTTYGELARRAGHPGLPRETGQALGSNPVPLVIPCHRILAAGGKIGGFSAPGGAAAKERMLALEGVKLGPSPSPQQAFSF